MAGSYEFREKHNELFEEWCEETDPDRKEELHKELEDNFKRFEEEKEETSGYKTYEVYYMALGKPEYRESRCMELYPKVIMDLVKTHVTMKRIVAKDLEDVFYIMNHWTPDEYETAKIRTETGHTSMMVGDVVYDVEEEKFHVCASCSWDELPHFPKTSDKETK